MTEYTDALNVNADIKSGCRRKHMRESAKRRSNVRKAVRCGGMVIRRYAGIQGLVNMGRAKTDAVISLYSAEAE